MHGLSGSPTLTSKPQEAPVYVVAQSTSLAACDGAGTTTAPMTSARNRYTARLALDICTSGKGTVARRGAGCRAGIDHGHQDAAPGSTAAQTAGVANPAGPGQLAANSREETPWLGRAPPAT